MLLPVLQYLLLDSDIQKLTDATISGVHLLEEVTGRFTVIRMHRVGSHSAPLTAPTECTMSVAILLFPTCSSHCIMYQ